MGVVGWFQITLHMCESCAMHWDWPSNRLPRQDPITGAHSPPDPRAFRNAGLCLPHYGLMSTVVQTIAAKGPKTGVTSIVSHSNAAGDRQPAWDRAKHFGHVVSSSPRGSRGAGPGTATTRCEQWASIASQRVSSTEVHRMHPRRQVVR